jgi:hypothetical protein
MNPNEQESQADSQVNQSPSQQPNYHQGQPQQSYRQSQIAQINGESFQQSAKNPDITTIKPSRKKWAYILLAISFVGISVTVAFFTIHPSGDETNKRQSDTPNTSSGPTNVVHGSVVRDGVEVVTLASEQRAQYRPIIYEVTSESLNDLLGITGKETPDGSYSGNCNETDDACTEGRDVLYKSKNVEDARRIVYDVVKKYLDQGWTASAIVGSEITLIQSPNEIQFDASTGKPKHLISLANYLTYEEEVIINREIFITSNPQPGQEEDLVFGFVATAYTWHP